MWKIYSPYNLRKNTILIKLKDNYGYQSIPKGSTFRLTIDEIIKFRNRIEWIDEKSPFFNLVQEDKGMQEEKQVKEDQEDKQDQEMLQEKLNNKIEDTENSIIKGTINKKNKKKTIKKNKNKKNK